MKSLDTHNIYQNRIIQKLLKFDYYYTFDKDGDNIHIVLIRIISMKLNINYIHIITINNYTEL